MKTQIIQLETHDDTISVKDRMDWSQTPRVLLVWPRGAKLLRNRLDLVLLERYCSANGSQLALLTRDQEVIDQAGEVGIPVFQSRKSAQNQAWGKSFREFRRRELTSKAGEPRELDLIRELDHPARVDPPAWVRIGVFSTAVLSVLAIGALLLPSASITIAPVKSTHTIQIPVKAVLGENEINISGQIPARELSVVVEGQAVLPATGSLGVPADYAAGEVVFTNLGDQSILIPENTYLSAEAEGSPIFVTQISGSTPEGIGQQVSIPVRALEPGRSGNLAENQLIRINQELGADLTVTNPLPLSGGEDLLVPAPSQADRDRLYATLQASLMEDAREELVQLLSEGDILLYRAPVIDQVLSSEFNPGEGMPGNSLSLNLKIRFRIEYAAGADLLALGTSAINARYQLKESSPLLDSIRLTNLTVPRRESASISTWNLEVAWEDQKNFHEPDIIQLVLGKKPAAAGQLLSESLGLTQTPDIQLQPEWWWRIPALPFRINLLQAGQ